MAAVAAALAGSSAYANHPVSTIGVNAPADAVQAGARWGERAATTSDMNADGKKDLWVATPSENHSSLTDPGKVRLVSGASLTGSTPGIIRSLVSPEPQGLAKFGFAISVLGDVSGDAKDDLAVGTDSQDVGGKTDQGKAWVFNGDTGAVLYALDNPAAQGSSRFGSRIGKAGDLTGDGKSEVIVGDSSYDSGKRVDQGRAYIFNGATGALYRTLEMPDPKTTVTCSSNCGKFGISVQGPGDVNGDGTPDQLVDAGNYNGEGRMYVMSGADGSVLRRIDSPAPEAGANFGFQDVAPESPGDVNGDGKADIYGNGFLTNSVVNGISYSDGGRAWVFSGATGAVLYEVVDPTPSAGGQFGWAMAKTNHDNLSTTPDDLYVGSAPHHNTLVDGNGGTYVFKGSDGSHLETFELPTLDRQLNNTSSNIGPNLGWSVAAPGDLNADGVPDYVAGAPFWDSSNQDQGRLYVFLSA